MAAGQTHVPRAFPAETAEFINFMMAGDLFDVLAKPGKAPGGYCHLYTWLQKPLHLLQFQRLHRWGCGCAYPRGGPRLCGLCGGGPKSAGRAAQPRPGKLRNPLHEHEFLTADYHKLFFKEDTAKYQFSHLEDALFFLPYGCMVDEFQENVYNQRI